MKTLICCAPISERGAVRQLLSSVLHRTDAPLAIFLIQLTFIPHSMALCTARSSPSRQGHNWDNRLHRSAAPHVGAAVDRMSIGDVAGLLYYLIPFLYFYGVHSLNPWSTCKVWLRCSNDSEQAHGSARLRFALNTVVFILQKKKAVSLQTLIMVIRRKGDDTI